MINKEFFSGRDIPDYHPESIQFDDWWSEQERRCIEGLEINGFRMTGYAYFYFNFFKIKVVTGYRNNGKAIFDLRLPNFSYKDNEFFDYVSICEKEGKDFLVITGRGEGKSYKVASLVSNVFTFIPNSTSYVTASSSEHLTKLWEKIDIGLGTLPDPFFRNRFIDDKKDFFIESGIRYQDSKKQNKEKGRGRIIQGINFGSRAGKSRGGRPYFVIYEEIGSWIGSASLKQCIQAMNNSLSVGMDSTGTSIYIGTGGEMESGGSEDAKDMFYNPEAYNLLTFDYRDTKTAYFIPAYQKFGGFYESKGEVLARKQHEKYGFKEGEVIGYVKEDGLNDDEGAKRFLEKKRAYILKDGSSDEYISAYNREIQEFPFTPEEAFMVSTESPFGFLKNRLEHIIFNKLDKKIHRGILEKTGNVLADGLPEVIFKYSSSGYVQIFEFPRWYNVYNREKDINEYTGLKSDLSAEDINGENLYVSGCDSYDQAKSAWSESKGSIFVFKRFSSIDESSGLFVAQITERPEEPEEFYEKTVLLNLFYRCKMLFEHTKIGIMSYYIYNKLNNLLWNKPRVTIPNMKVSKATNKYGYLMNDKYKNYAIEKYVKYCRENQDKFYFTDQLKDHIEFNLLENRFDRTMASMLCIIQDLELGFNYEKKQKRKEFKLPVYKIENGRIVLKYRD